MRYKDLTQQQTSELIAHGILNGCGPANWRGKAPQWFFKANCQEHDFNYALGGTEADRRWSDWGFYQAMIRDTRRMSWYKAYPARFVAWAFYRLVRWKGKKQFKHRETNLHVTFEQLIDESF